MNLLHTFAQYEYDYEYTTTSTTVDQAVAAQFGIAFLIFFLITSIIAYVVTSYFLSKVFRKTGLAAWPAWVPFYNVWKILELGGQKGYWAVLALIPFVNYVSAVFIAIAMYYIGIKFGKPGSFVLLAIFLPIVWIIWLAVDNSKWNDKLGTVRSIATGPKPTA